HPDGREWLPPRLRWHHGRFSIVSQCTARLLRRNLGSIVSETVRPVHLLISESPPAEPTQWRPVGSLEESYADRLRPGDRFLLDGQSWQFRRVEDFAVLVDQVVGRPNVPQWTT